MHRRPLHRHISPPHHRLGPVVQDHLYGAFDHDAEVEGLGPVHHAFIAGGEVDHAADDARGVHEAELAGGDYVVVCGDVFVVGEGGGEGVGEDLVEGHCLGEAGEGVLVLRK